MNKNDYQNKFIEEIKKHSINQTWDDIRKEWKFQYCFQNAQECICTHPIHNVCVIANLITGEVLKIGNCCVNHFLDINEGNHFFESSYNLSKNLYSSLKNETIKFLYDNKIFDQYKYDFYLKIKRKRKLSDKQKEFKKKCNIIFIQYMKSNIKKNKTI